MAIIENLKPIEKGKRYVGRAPGVQNRTTRAMKLALIEAAEESEHSDGCLKGYCKIFSEFSSVSVCKFVVAIGPGGSKNKNRSWCAAI